MRKFALAALTVGAVALPSIADAALYSKEGDFDSIIYSKGSGVSDDRDDKFRMFDGNANDSMLSLGLGGSITFTVKPGEQISSGSIIEVTFQSNHSEAADLYLGSERIATLINEIGGTNGNASVSNHQPSLANVTANNVDYTNNKRGGSWTLTVVSPIASAFSSIKLVDVSKSLFPTSGTTDGFDIGEFRLTTVPVPAAVVLLGSALAGLGVMRRRRKGETASAAA